MSAQPAARSSPAMTATLYALVVLIWGSTWIALKLQLGAVPVELSIAYRFALAAVLMFAWLAWSRQRRAAWHAQLPLSLIHI